MIAIEINGKLVETAENESIELDLVNPYLIYDRIQRSAIKSPTFPGTSRNHQVFKYAYEPTNGVGFPEFNWKHYLDGDLIREGFFRLKEATLQGYAGEFDDRTDQFFGDFQFKILSELNFGTLARQLPASGEVSVSGQLAYCLPSVINPDYYGTNQTSYTGYMNGYQTGQYVANSPKVPMFFVSYIIQKIAELTNTTITGNFLTHPTWSKLLLFNTRESGEVITVANHLPSLSVIDFFMELRKLPNLMLDFSAVNRTLKIEFWEEKLAAPTVLDWTKKAVLGEIKIPETKTRLQLSYDLDTGDGRMKDKPVQVQDYITPEQEGFIYSDIAAVRSRFSTLLTDASTGLAVCQQIGVTEAFAQLTNRFAPRLLFWHGVTNAYPRATNELNNTSLFWNGTNGLAAKSWQETEAWRRNQFYLKKNFVLTGADLATLDFSKKIHVNGVNYLIAALNISNPIRSVAQCLLVAGN